MRTDLQRERHVVLYTLVEAEKVADEREGHAGLQHAQRAPLRTAITAPRPNPQRTKGIQGITLAVRSASRNSAMVPAQMKPETLSRKIRTRRTRSSADMTLFRRRQVGGGYLELLSAEMV